MTALAQTNYSDDSSSDIPGNLLIGVDQSIQGILQTVNSTPSVPIQDLSQSLKETKLCIWRVCLPGLDRWVIDITKIIIRHMVSSTVKWINSGFNGNPAYVTNPGQYFTDIADGIAGEYIRNDPELGLLCSPFQANIRASLAQQYYEPQKFQCTLSNVVGNIEDFYQDFSKGGWDAWFTMTQNPTNNPYGAYLEAKASLDSRIANALGQKKSQLDWGKGFMSWESCADGEQEWYLEGTEKVCVKDGKSRKPTISTPGSVIEDQLSNVLGTGVRQLELADSFNEIIGALMAQLLQKTVFNSRGGLSKARIDPGSTTRAPIGSYTNIDIDGDEIPDGADTNGDGDIDICFFGGVNGGDYPPCVTSSGGGDGAMCKPGNAGNDPGAPETIDEASVIWDENPGVKNWPITSSISGYSVSRDSITLEYDKANVWPKVYFDFLGCTPTGGRSGSGECKPAVGNAWIIVWRNGAWHASTFEWMGPGQTKKGLDNLLGADGTLRGELGNFAPRLGEVYGFAISTIARNGNSGPVNERTNIVTIRWNGPSCFNTDPGSEPGNGWPTTPYTLPHLTNFRAICDIAQATSTVGNHAGTPGLQPGEAIDAQSIIWDEAPSVKNWKETANLYNVVSTTTNPLYLRIEYDKAFGNAPAWPKVGTPDGTLVGHAWIIAWRNGAWHASIFENLVLPTQTIVSPEYLIRGDGILKGVLGNFSVIRGQTYGFAVTTPVRNGAGVGRNERSQIMSVRWNYPICDPVIPTPPDDGGI